MLITLRDEDGNFLDKVTLEYIPRVGDQLNIRGETHTRTYIVEQVHHTVSATSKPYVMLIVCFRGRFLNELIR